MNVQEMLMRTTTQVGEDALDDESRRLAMDFLNEAHEEMMRIYKPYIDLTAGIPEDGRLKRSMLGECAGRILSAKCGDAEYAFETDGEYLRIAGGAGKEMTFRCRYRPKMLVADADEPNLPKTACGALADYAAYRLMQGGGRGRQQRGDVYYSRYLQRKAALAQESDYYREYIANKY